MIRILKKIYSWVEFLAKPDLFNIIAPLGLGLVVCQYYYKYYRDSVSLFKLQNSADICSQMINASKTKLQRCDNISELY
ncbi:MAG: hypothetical protein EA361_15400 [Bacteroidetes bacterium]|nr:MAG: hypothetical protein EA361_15400 [Bacteroidota bacterium]